MTTDNIVMEVPFLDKKEIRRKTAKPLIWVALVGMIMFFAGLTSAVIISKSSSPWHSFSIPNYFLYSTVLIILSSILYHLGLLAIKKGHIRRLLTFVIVTILLTCLFIYFQFLGWRELYTNGVVAAGTDSHSAGSYFYILTFLHLLHLLGGVISLIVVFFKTKWSKYSKEDHIGVNVSVTYWHFLTILWVYLYLFLQFVA